MPNAATGVGDERLDGGALDGKEANEVLWRRQQHHVDNMLVVGAGGAIVEARLGDEVDRILGHSA